jgi:hypothetical protein
MLKFPFVLRSKYERLERESQWIAGQFVNVHQEAERLHNDLCKLGGDYRFVCRLSTYYKELAHKYMFRKNHPRADNGRFIQIEVKQCN